MQQVMVARWRTVFLRRWPGSPRFLPLPRAVAAPRTPSPHVRRRPPRRRRPIPPRRRPQPAVREVDELSGFISPTGNVACMIAADWARCDIIDRDWSPPPTARGLRVRLRPGDLGRARRTGPVRLRRRHRLRPGFDIAVRRVDQCRGVAVREHGGWHHVPRSPDRPRLLDFSRGVSAVLTSPANDGSAAGVRFVRLRLSGLSSSFATGDVSFVARGCSAVGSASPCQGEGRGFESRHPLEGASGINPSGGVAEW